MTVPGRGRMRPAPECTAAAKDMATGSGCGGGGEAGDLLAPHGRSAREQQAQLKHKLRELPALLRSGLTLRRKSGASTAAAAAAASSTCSSPVMYDRISDPCHDHSTSEFSGERVSCAGRALRDALTGQACGLIKDRMFLTGVCRRSFVGSELVDWILQYCAFVHRRSSAAGVWQILLKMGILSSVDKQLCFQDTYAFYQFSDDECNEAFCEFGRDNEWQNGVRLLQQLVPTIPSSPSFCSLSTERLEETIETSNEMLQLQALARFTSAVQRELAAVIALKAKSALIQDEENHHTGTILPSDRKHTEAREAGVMCKLQEREDIGRIELVQKLARESCQLRHTQKKEFQTPEQQDDEVSAAQVKGDDQDGLVLRKVSSESPAPAAGSGEHDWRYMVVSGTPEKILEHLLNGLHLDDGRDKETDTLLDDFLLTYTVFMTTNDFCQALLRHYGAKNYEAKGESSEALCTKRKVLHLASEWTTLYKDWLHDDEHSKLFLKTLYRYVLDDVFEYPILEKELKEFQKALRMHRRHTVDEYSPHRKNKTLFHQFSLKENWLLHRGSVTETEEIFFHVHITEHSYVSIKAKVSASAQEILKIVAEKIQYAEEHLALVSVTFSGEKNELQPNDLALAKSLESSSRIFTYRKDLSDTLNPFAENEESQPRSVRILGMNTWDLATELTNFDWSLFNSVHEQELIYFTFSRQGSGGNTVNLSLLLQRCNEVQLWVATEILLCSQLVKRVQLLKKFIKIAAHCKAQKNLNSFFAIIMGLNTASVSRLSQTWEKIPGKFRKLFSELESLTDPSLNHKAYRDTFKKMKPPKIPFMPLLLKDVTFIHEGNKTFLDNLVNFEKLHMIADTVRSLRYCRNNQYGVEVPQKEHQEVKSCIHHLHVIDSQQMLFELSHRIEPRV
ncbi:rap guanine nucleotide exchange factor 5 isoform X2 [Ambystoma mexicanum]|uniref:rap guanine nucleotide exchange factor 5 isoform X2 n=1 Tax=Ambystoma mexicanum TaxID=8296 RepID=UPI0037E7E151